MRPRLMIPLVLMLAVAGTAAAQDVRYNFDKSANFASFKTYKWVPIKGACPRSDVPLAETRYGFLFGSSLSSSLHDESSCCRYWFSFSMWTTWFLGNDLGDVGRMSRIAAQLKG